MNLAEKYKFGDRWPWLGEVEIRDVVVPEIRVTAVMPEELEEQFRGSIAAQGVLNPVKCIWDGERIILVDGFHRMMEALRNKMTTVPAVIVPGSLRDVMFQNLTTGKLQGRGKVTDMIKVVKYLVEEEKIPLEDIAVKTGYKLRYLSDLLAIAKAHPDILMALDEEKIPLGAAVEIARIPDKDAQLKVLWNAIMYRMTIKDVKDLVQKTIEALRKKKKEAGEEQQRTPRELVLLQCHLCEGKVPAKDMRTVFLCPHCMNILWDMKLEAMKELEKQAQVGSGAPAEEPIKIEFEEPEEKSGEQG
ncbi:MAG: ParB/RepB/Spo0J family partition protein, partial [Sulfolobales archaeon]